MKTKINLDIRRIDTRNVKCKELKAIQEQNEKADRHNNAERNLSNIGNNGYFKTQENKYWEVQNKVLKEVLG